MSSPEILALIPALMPIPQPAFFGRALRVVDGDTLELDVWKWDETHAIWGRARLALVNAPELPTPPGLVARAFVVSWLASADPVQRWPLIVYTQARDNYGRPIVAVWRRSDGANLSADLLASGNAVPYPPAAAPQIPMRP